MTPTPHGEYESVSVCYLHKIIAKGTLDAGIPINKWLQVNPSQSAFSNVLSVSVLSLENLANTFKEDEFLNLSSSAAQGTDDVQTNPHI